MIKRLFLLIANPKSNLNYCVITVNYKVMPTVATVALFIQSLFPLVSVLSGVSTPAVSWRQQSSNFLSAQVNQCCCKHCQEWEQWGANVKQLISLSLSLSLLSFSLSLSPCLSFSEPPPNPSPHLPLMKGAIVSDLDWKTHTVLFLWGLKNSGCLTEKRFALLAYVLYSFSQTCACTQIWLCTPKKQQRHGEHTTHISIYADSRSYEEILTHEHA